MVFTMMKTCEYDFSNTYDWLITIIYYEFRIDLFELISRYGIDTKHGDLPGYTPLEIAIFYNKPSIVKLLIEYGADPNIGLDYVTINYMITCNYMYHAKILLEHGALVTRGNIIDATGELRELFTSYQKIDVYDNVDYIEESVEYNQY